MQKSFVSKNPNIKGKVVVGVCTLDRKTQTKPMQQIIKSMSAFGEFEMITFGNDTIFNKKVEDWPICDVLISFFTSGFPSQKAEEYCSLRKPFMLNDVPFQKNLLSRERVYTILRENNIPAPQHIIFRDPSEYPDSEQELVESEDYIEIHYQKK
eukprot:TRINITY_DN19544_c0_g1_i1.p1 TRINITY_DN19544_c0_g1~~TRINITY_DN19544_c0_g1_i1.p1  ORF type:complete len:154 (+),score=39.81 TRINITY_DN19544_c0_g1_i1:152-613(+)